MADALPYLVPSEEAVRAGAWTVRMDSGKSGLPEWLPYWDMSQTLQATRELEINLDRVYSESHLPETCRLGLSVVYTSDLEDKAHVTTFDETHGTIHPQVDIEIPGSFLGTAITLSTALVLRESGEQVEDPVAWRRGSVLWSDRKKVRLYGDSSQFPITELDFGERGSALDPGAPWFLQIDSDLELPAMGAIQLLLNSRFPLVSSAVRSVGGGQPELAAVRSELFADIGRTLVEFALAQDELNREWPEDSLGTVLTSVLTSHFRESVTDLHRLRDHDPAVWAAKLAATFGLLREPLR